MKHKNHDKIIEKLKNKKLEKLATKLLKQDEKHEKLKEIKTKGDFLKLF